MQKMVEKKGDQALTEIKCASWHSALMLHLQGVHHDGVRDVFADDPNDDGKGECAQKPQHIHYMRCQLVDFPNHGNT